MNALRDQAIDIIHELPDYDLEYAVNILKNILDISLHNHSRNRLSKEDAWTSFMEGINGFTEDFMPDGREPVLPSAREEL